MDRKWETKWERENEKIISEKKERVREWKRGHEIEKKGEGKRDRHIEVYH